ncbi:hypothetical protein [Frigidibacter sp. MR17.24]|uniref:hypothetical protein n=1 Tax=Frigidibacter sp. MR17.24 TaxID=3127345 RepID=UPI00301309C6
MKQPYRVLVPPAAAVLTIALAVAGGAALAESLVPPVVGTTDAAASANLGRYRTIAPIEQADAAMVTRSGSAGRYDRSMAPGAEGMGGFGPRGDAGGKYQVRGPVTPGPAGEIELAGG